MKLFNQEVSEDFINFFYKKQEQLYLFVKHQGIVTWYDIKKASNDLFLSRPCEEKIWKLSNSIYHVFYPLVYNGLIEATTTQFGFIIAPEVPLFYSTKEKDTKNYMEHFYCSDESKVIHQNDLFLNASRLLNRCSTLYEMIQSWGTPIHQIPVEAYVRKNLYNLDDTPTKGEFLPSYFLFKKNSMEYYPDFIQIENMHYEIPNRFDALNIARNFIKANSPNNYAIFEYNKNTKLLKCSNYFELPVIIYRALLLYDAEKLKDKEIYLPNRNNLAFSNIPQDAVENLKRIYKPLSNKTNTCCIKEI